MTTNRKDTMGVPNMATGQETGAGEAITVTLGFVPRKVRVFNETDVILWEKFSGQAAANTRKVVAGGTMTKDTGSAITISGNSFILSATLAASGKALYWEAHG